MDSPSTTPHYDRGLIPAEVAAREEREHDTFRRTPSKENDQAAKTDDQTDPESIDTTSGYSVDKEGLVDNFAIEPEMYINEPGDLREKEEALKREHAQELKDANEDEDGKLTMDRDTRPKGPGLI
ncbi:hypothetical protein H6F73_10435 [Microcoleus sp. FACHB-68]|nr:hypothetical protein [Microcoleus sp. FACHB-68]